MKTFRTAVSIKPAKRSLGFKNKVFTIGSCFADVIGHRLKKYKIFSSINPFGTIYNPVSMHKALQMAFEKSRVLEHTYLQHDELFSNYDFHSQFSATDKNALKKKIENVVAASHEALKQADTILVTYGTAWIYERIDTREIVANCHKMPQTLFSKRLLSVEEIITSFRDTFEKINSTSRMRVIITVSPVRHIKDTLELNGVSKAVLRTACHELTRLWDNIEYFPAYEIMMDDLRDYRFYKSDMLHPTEDAEDYVWLKFSERYFDDQTRELMTEWDSILAAMNHKAFHPQSAAHQKFLKNTLSRLEKFSSLIDTKAERDKITSQIVKGD